MHFYLPTFFKPAPVPLAVLAFSFPAYSQTGQSPEGKALVNKMLSGMVFVKGGTFMMGDFGVEVSPEKLAYISQHENKPAHQVMLDSFSISKYKISFH